MKNLNAKEKEKILELIADGEANAENIRKIREAIKVLYDEVYRLESEQHKIFHDIKILILS